MKRYFGSICLLIGLGTYSTAQGAGVIVAAGGGSEGDMGDTTSWSYKLYKKLVENGDVTGDGRVVVAIISSGSETSWLPSYFEWMGADDAFNIQVSTRNAANDSAVVGSVATADVVFIKGGDQGEYYDLWNDTLLEQHIRTVVDGHAGALGGTSAGAMSQSQYCFAGGKDYVSLDVLKDAQTPYLDDTDGGSGIHTDFLGFIPNTVIDTHFTSRGRLGRLAGILAKANDDNNKASILALGIEERTGIFITGSRAEVIGNGTVDLIRQSSASIRIREARRPLVYSYLLLDRLTEGWEFDLATHSVDVATRPSSAVPVDYIADTGSNSGSLMIRGSRYGDEERFARTIDYDPDPYRTLSGTSRTYIRRALGLTNAHDSDYRGAVQESLFRALYDYPDYSGFLVAYEGMLSRASSTANQIKFERNRFQSGNEAATIVIDGQKLVYKDLSPYISGLDTGSNTLKAVALVGARMHILAESDAWGLYYDSRYHEVVDLN